MLKQMLKDKDSLKNIHKATYAEVAIGKIQKVKRPPSIVIKKTNANETLQKFTQAVSHHLIQNKAIQT